MTRKFKMPQVVGALAAGLILGPAMLGWLQETEFIDMMAELGVIVLMFTAGLETDIKELKKSGKASFVIALIGVIVPLAGGFGLAYFFNHEGINDASASIFLQNIFIGIILTATSVSISVETLKEMGKLNTRAGNAILGAAIIDDILGIVALTIVTSLADSSVNVAIVLLKIVAFFVFAIVFGIVFYLIFGKLQKYYNKDLRRFVIIAFVFCLLLSYLAEVWFGVADITGAFIAGVWFPILNGRNILPPVLKPPPTLLLSPVFFASIGLKVSLPRYEHLYYRFLRLLLIVAILTKIVGCGLGAKMCRYSNAEALQIGCGMISRGEVALIVANKGAALGLMSTTFFGPIIITVVATTIIAPILLKLVFRSPRKAGRSICCGAEENHLLPKAWRKFMNIPRRRRPLRRRGPESIIKKKNQNLKEQLIKPPPN